jgi:PEGA domain-containing protein
MRGTICSVLILLASSVLAVGQEKSGKLSVEVLDHVGAPLPGVEVIIRENDVRETTAEYDALRSGSGRTDSADTLFATGTLTRDLPPGTYAVFVHSSGFAPMCSEVTVKSGRTTRSRFRLKISKLTEMVTVD